MTFFTEKEKGDLFGKPRFNHRFYSWPEQLLVDLRNHLQDLWFFFDRYSFYFDRTIFPLLAHGEKRESKKSILFLLERDVWETDEVYGKYLINIRKTDTKIGYYRFGKIYREILLSSTNMDDIINWICKDAVRQIQNQFIYLWNKIEKEIKVCIKEEHTKKPIVELDSNYLQEQFKKTKEIVEEWPEAALLSLGRIIEIWLLIELEEISQVRKVIQIE
ncbi:MAG: hypothetical protein GF311_26560 [Candidatus Lokiarchaeota archaeon]|nr:hypothetical protein [Candidatus Lokiarchaeota archaeon]